MPAPPIEFFSSPCGIFVPSIVHLFCSLGIEKHQLVRRLRGTPPDQGSLAWHHNLNSSFYLAARDVLRPFFWPLTKNSSRIQSVCDNHCECGLADIYEHGAAPKRKFATPTGAAKPVYAAVSQQQLVAAAPKARSRAAPQNKRRR